MAATHQASIGDVDALQRHSIAGLDGLNFFVADMLTGFGPFVTVYLAANGWLPSAIGIALSVGTIAAQIPASSSSPTSPTASGLFNLGMGLVGLAMTAGATLTTTLTGFVTQHLGIHIAFLGLGAATGAGCLLVLLVMPETGDAPKRPATAAYQV